MVLWGMDHLPQRTTTEVGISVARLHISRGFKHRQWWARCAANNVVSCHYNEKVKVDSLEVLPLDISLFTDPLKKVVWLVTATAKK